MITTSLLTVNNMSCSICISYTIFDSDKDINENVLLWMYQKGQILPNTGKNNHTTKLPYPIFFVTVLK